MTWWKHALLLMAVVVVAACHYDKPLGAAAGTEADAALVGRWKITANADGEGSEEQTLVVHRTAEKLLVVDYQVSATEHWYFTGYPCITGHPEILELQFLGDSTGKPNTDHRYLMVKATVDKDSLQWATMDPDKLRPSDDTDAFRKAVKGALDANKDIFAKTLKGTREKIEK
ncbi:MAG: hypothetical protein QM755_06585 [Luteolibacter sp.]